MKVLLFILLTAIGLRPLVKTQSACRASDFMQLQSTELQKSFFQQRDSVLKAQYPNNDSEPEIMVDLTTAMLSQFLKDINQAALSKTGNFEHQYHFNIAPEGASDPEICKDRITIEFFREDCRFRMEIYNTFFAEWCQESMVVYAFEIRAGKVVNFYRNEAG